MHNRNPAPMASVPEPGVARVLIVIPLVQFQRSAYRHSRLS
jgi:hypothetical protein